MSSAFEQRKQDHLKLALQDQSQVSEYSDFQSIQLSHDSLPELDLADVCIESNWLDQTIATPLFVAGMTAGHEHASQVNQTLARIAEKRGWLFGLGSQRREFDQPGYQDLSHLTLKQQFPKLRLLANLGVSQLVEAALEARMNDVMSMIANLDAIAIHLNPLQEAIQQEGTPRFKGAIQALRDLIRTSPIPVIIKETGTGMSTTTLEALFALKPFAIDVSGLGGTHWGRIEGQRAEQGSLTSRLGETFGEWGVSTVESLMNAGDVQDSRKTRAKTEIWASGGVRTGLDAAKCFALGAKRVGFAQPALKAALQGENALDEWMHAIETELRIAMFCTGSRDLYDLNLTKVEGI